MAYYAYTHPDHKGVHRIEARLVTTPEEQNADYFCPGCNARYRFKSLSSNGRAPHFFLCNDQHSKDCWVPRSESAGDGNIDAFDLADFTPESLLERIKTHRRTEPESPFSTVSESVLSDESSESAKSVMHVHTLRQLYAICTQNPDSFQFPDGTRIKDIFCGEKTSYLYTQYCSGIKLVEAVPYRFNSQDREIVFHYPRRAKESLLVFSAYFSNDRLFTLCANRLFPKGSSMIQRPTALLYGIWTATQGSSSSKIDDSHQIVVLKT